MIANRWNPLGKRLKDTHAMGYIQDGLVLHLDGLENVGYGRFDASSKVWVDLVSGRVFSNRTNAVTPITFENGYCHIYGSNYSYLECPNCEDIEDLFLNKTLSVSFALNGTYSSNGSNVRIGNVGARTSMMSSPYIHLADKMLVSNSNLVTVKENITETVTLDNGSYNGYVNQIRRIMYAYTSSAPPTLFDDKALRIGLGNYVYQSVATGFYAIRIYNRALTNEEVFFNHAIDAERFGL